jgi:flagellar M-ring protein FliF
MAASEAVDIVAKQQKLIAQLEGKYRTDVLIALQKIFCEDRVRDLNIKIDMDMSKKQAQTTEYSAIVITPDNPDTPYDDSLTREYLPLASETLTKEWNGTFYSPEGPAGTAGQNPPVYADMTNQIGTSRETSAKQSNAINTKHIQEEKSPAIDRVAVSVNIDGTWKRKYDEKGNPLFTPSGSIDREYVPVDAQSLTQATSLVQGAVGYNRTRGDLVMVTNIAFDRSAQFDTEDAAFRRTRQTRFAFLIIFGAIALAIVLIVVIRALILAARRRREQKALEQPVTGQEWASPQEIEIPEADRRRAEMVEAVTAMAQEHPEDVAKLMETWLTED